MSVYTCRLDGSERRHAASGTETSTVLTLPGRKTPAGWTPSGQIKVFVKDPANDGWRPCLLEDRDGIAPIFL